MKKALITLLMVSATSGCMENDTSQLVEIVGRSDTIALKASSNHVLLAVGQEDNLRAIAEQTDGSGIEVEPDSWFVADPNVAEISDEGVISAKSIGSSIVGYKWLDQEITFPVTVSEATLESIGIKPETLSGDQCTATTVSVIGVYTDGSTNEKLDPIVWTSSDESIAAVTVNANDLNAVVKFNQSGVAQLSAEYLSLNHTIQATVADTLAELVPLEAVLDVTTGETHSLEIVGKYNDGTESDISELVTIQPIQLTSPELFASPTSEVVPEIEPAEAEESDSEDEDILDPDSIVSVESLYRDEVITVSRLADGMLEVTGLSEGTAEITFECGGLSTVQTVQVNDPVVLESIALEPSEIQLTAGSKIIPTVIATYSDGSESILTDDLLWRFESGDIDDFTLDEASGEIAAGENVVVEKSVLLNVETGLFSDVATVYAEYGKTEVLSGISLLQVDSLGAAPIEINTPFALQVTGIIQVAVQAEYNTSRIEVLSNEIYWSTSDSAIAEVDSEGVITAISPGFTKISALAQDQLVSVWVLVEAQSAPSPVP